MLILDLLQFSGSMLLIYYGANFLIKYGKILAISLGISPYIVGLTIIALGTSFPELVVNLKASIISESDIAFGNIIGSNIANIGLVFSICFIIRSIKIKYVSKDNLIFFLLSAFFAAIFSMDGFLTFFEGSLLFSGFILYCFNLARHVRKESSNKNNKYKFDIYLIIIIFSSFALLIIGSDLFIKSAINIAETIGVSKIVISMTMVAFGTSLPELATSVVAVIRKEYDLLLGNIIGSNIMNILLVLGSSVLINQIKFDTNIIAIILMFSLTAGIFLYSVFKIEISRIMGIFLFIIYCTFIYSNFYLAT